MSKIKKIFIVLGIVFLILFCFFFIGSPPEAKEIKWGVNFSQKHTELLGLDWRETYLALLNDLQVKRIKLITYWDLIERESGQYDFADLDWQIQQAEEKEVKLLLVIGMKTPRWPECHIPEWAKSWTMQEQQQSILKFMEKITSRYQISDSIWGWQIENEPFFPFGDCPWTDREFLRQEIKLVKSLDKAKRPILISDSGEGSPWIRAAQEGDMVGTTLYKKVWFRQLGIYVYYPLPPIFYYRKAQIIKKLFDKKVIGVELQAEPWGPKLLYDSPLEEQEKTMNLERFKNIINFASKTGFDEFYLWGAEWWYWMKQTQSRPEIWNEAKSLF